MPTFNFARAAEQVLGPKYDLSLVFVASHRSRTLNHHYRGKDYSANVLSFPFDNQNGEMIIDLEKLVAEAKRLGMSHRERLVEIFIHGLLHLKGLDHGSKMESLESQLVRHFQKNNEQNNRHRVRCR